MGSSRTGLCLEPKENCSRLEQEGAIQERGESLWERTFQGLHTILEKPENTRIQLRQTTQVGGRQFKIP